MRKHLNRRLDLQPENASGARNRRDEAAGRSAPHVIQRIGRGLALAGVVFSLLLIGGLKLTQLEVEALLPLIGGTPGWPKS